MDAKLKQKARELAQRLRDAANLPDHGGWRQVLMDCGHDADLLARALQAQQPEARVGGAVEPFGWVYQHEETGHMSFCPNDGVNTPEIFQRLNSRHVLCGPVYTTPPAKVPEGWKLVPVEATPEMLRVFMRNCEFDGEARQDYADLLAAAPAPKEGV